MLKIVHLQFSPESSGRAALRLHKAFLEADVDSSILFFHPWSLEEERIKKLGGNSKLIYRLEHYFQMLIARKTNTQFGLFSFPFFGTDVTKKEQIMQADVIYLHWILWGVLNLKNIEKLAKMGKPVIFFMHDMWSMTGGCHHSFDCLKYRVQCIECQALICHIKNDLSWFGFNKKAKLYSKYDNLYFVSPSRWLLDCAKQSQLTKSKPLFYIPNIIDNKLYKPFDKRTAKQILNLELNDYVITFGAVAIDSPYKGWEYLKKALAILYQNKNFRKITVLIFGGATKDEIHKEIPFKVKYLGYLKDEYSMSLVYNATDVFIAPSLAEVFGYVIFESLSCGTPVVAFDVGGIPDLIKHKYNGYLAKYKDAEDLATGIEYCIENNVVGKIIPDFEKSQILKKHLSMIDSILDKH
jgi:glycosyltransferase involved in cell wall biosynthesis